jgi:hypothetical protein
MIVASFPAPLRLIPPVIIKLEVLPVAIPCRYQYGGARFGISYRCLNGSERTICRRDAVGFGIGRRCRRWRCWGAGGLFSVEGSWLVWLELQAHKVANTADTMAFFILGPLLLDFIAGTKTYPRTQELLACKLMYGLN